MSTVMSTDKILAKKKKDTIDHNIAKGLFLFIAVIFNLELGYFIVRNQIPSSAHCNAIV